MAAGLLLGGAACRLGTMDHAADRRPAEPAASRPGMVDRGAALYAAYCVGCHGAAGDGRGPLAAMLGLQPTDLRTPAVRRISDRDLVARVLHGTPLLVMPGKSPTQDDLDVQAVATYLRTLAIEDRELLRAGRLVYEGACAACHGAYGHADGVLTLWLGVPDLLTARERYTDTALARISVEGIGTMPALMGEFDPGEVRALIAYVRHLSDGFRVYDTYCAACHGEDGQGLYAQDLVPPATTAPPLHGPYEPRQILHMLRRGQHLMPHLRDVVGEAEVAAIVAYLRTLPSREPEPLGDSSHRQ